MSLQPLPTVRIVVTDTNILINLAQIGRLDLLGKLPPYLFVVPEEVVKEVRNLLNRRPSKQPYPPASCKLSN
jgi:predicted nucleic acid-binding protein